MTSNLDDHVRIDTPEFHRYIVLMMLQCSNETLGNKCYMKLIFVLSVSDALLGIDFIFKLRFPPGKSIATKLLLYIVL